MAGGMSRRGRGMPMEQRVALSSASGASPLPSGPSGSSGPSVPRRGGSAPVAGTSPAAPAVPAAPAPARHCWVLVPADGSGERRAGLLLEWRRHDRDWQARVVYNVRLRTGGWALLEEWLPAADVTAG